MKLYGFERVFIAKSTIVCATLNVENEENEGTKETLI
jgi:hypothetical protein